MSQKTSFRRTPKAKPLPTTLTETQEKRAKDLFRTGLPPEAIASQLGALRSAVYDFGVRLGYITPVKRSPTVIPRSKKQRKAAAKKARIGKSKETKKPIEVKTMSQKPSKIQKAKAMLSEGTPAIDVSIKCGIKKDVILKLQSDLGLQDFATITPDLIEKAQIMIRQGKSRLEVSEALNLRLADVRQITIEAAVDAFDSSEEPPAPEHDNKESTENTQPEQAESKDMTMTHKTESPDISQNEFDLTKTVRIRVNPIRIAANALMDAMAENQGDRKEQIREALIATVRSL